MKILEATYDPQADAAAVYVSERGSAMYSESLDERRVVDYNDSGALVSMEFLGVSRGIEREGLPNVEGLEQLLLTLERIAAEGASSVGAPSVPAGDLLVIREGLRLSTRRRRREKV